MKCLNFTQFKKMEGLYRTPRTYFDSGCHEYQEYPVKQKLLDIGFATWHGYDIMQDIRYILCNYPHVSESDIQRAIWYMLAEVNQIDESKYYQFDRKNSIETDVTILLEDLMRVFRLPEGDRRKAYLADDPRSIQFHELDAMNGWKMAFDNREAYNMYSFGNWIMFPGDGKLIRQFNIDKATPTCCYPSYVYPEPWYGGPTSAKIVVLGNEARYDDFISRIQNIILSHWPQLAEGVQLTVERWLAYGSGYFYEPSLSDYPCKEIAVMDPYNSPTYRHWFTEFLNLANALDIETNYDFYSKIAVINANPYPSIGVPPLAAGMLPSHYFLRQLVRFITNNDKNVLFVLPSETLRPVWRTILADVYTDLVAFGRMIVINRDKSISLTRKISPKHLHQIRSLLTT